MSGKRRVERAGDREPEHAVTEEGEALEGVDPALGPGGVGQRLTAERRRQLLDQRGKGGDGLAPGSRVGRRAPSISGRRPLEDEGDRVADRRDPASPAPRRP